jgi:anti-sigma B factor antagonist
MTTPAARMLVLVGAQFACIRIIGRANFTSGIDFKTLLNELQQKGYSYFVLDLSECALMDSTFLGVLAGFGIKMNAARPGRDGSPIELVNPNPRVAELLENLGVIHLFKVTRGPLTLPQGVEACDHSPVQSSRADVQRACLEAHQTLMAINPDNVARFKDITLFLAEDLKKLKAKGEAG